MSSQRNYAILLFGAHASGAVGGSAFGGNALLATPQHRLDGPEHLEAAADETRLDATVDHHGLLPLLSGIAAERLDGLGAFRAVDAVEVAYDNTASGLTAAQAQAAIDELAATVSAGGLDDLSDVTLTAPATADRLRYDGAVWRNSSLIWKPVMDGLGNVVTDSGTGAAIMTEVSP